MTWFKVHSDIHADRWVARAGVEAMGLWVTAGSWCAAEFNGGFLPTYMARRLDPGYCELALRLVDARLWAPAVVDGDDGWQFLREGELWSCTIGLRRQKVLRAVRALVYQRDGYHCVTCGSPDDLTLDHIWPWSLGGDDAPDNLQTMCRPCNSSKGARV